MNDNERLSIELMTELHHQLGIAFEDFEYLEDEAGEKHLYFIAEIRGAKVYFDRLGQVWMPEAEIVRATDMSKQAVNVAIQRLEESNLGGSIFQVNNLLTLQRGGRKRLMTFYDEETVAAIITRGRDQSPKALAFLAERKQIIQTVRYLIFSYSISQREVNQDLVERLGELERQLLDAEYRVHWAEQDAAQARRELLEKFYGELDDMDDH